MLTLFAGIYVQNKNRDYLKLEPIDGQQTVVELKAQIANRISSDANDLELIYNGIALSDDTQLSSILRSEATVFCFTKTKKPAPFTPAANVQDPTNTKHIQELFQVISNTSISINSRVAILQKILAEYPEFRRNLGAQAMIRDSVLFNTLQEPQVVAKVAVNYPIICEAAPFIVDTVKKELARNSTLHSASELATDSTNSSEDDSLGGSSSSERVESTSSTARFRSESEQIRLISRQQLQAALSQIGRGSINSLSNIAQRNADTDAAAAAAASADANNTGSSLSQSNSRGRISAENFRQQVQQAMATANDNVQQMDTSDDFDNVPARYRNHQYADQLRQMHQMGFKNYELNLTYLDMENGNLENAVNLLIATMP